METKRIRDALGERFEQQVRRIVFWHDPDREFEDVLEELTLDGGVLPVSLHEFPPLARYRRSPVLGYPEAPQCYRHTPQPQST